MSHGRRSTNREIPRWFRRQLHGLDVRLVPSTVNLLGVQVELGAVALTCRGPQGQPLETWCVPCPTSSQCRRLVNVLNAFSGC